MKKLIKHVLEFNQTFEYINDVLQDANQLSREYLESFDFKKGGFFNLLPEDADLSRMYFFKRYILKQNPIIKCGEGSENSRYQIIPTVREETASFLVNKLNKNKSLSCIVDDVTRLATDTHHMKLYDYCGLFFENEIYYFGNCFSFSQKILIDCMQKSNAFWHSLCVLTEVSFDDVINKQLTLEKIKEICQKTQMVVVGAYDGEGYIFWEKP